MKHQSLVSQDICSKNPIDIVEYKFLTRTVLKAQQGITKVPESSSDVPNASVEGGESSIHTNGQVSSDLAALQQQLSEMTHARDYYYYEMYNKETELTAMVRTVADIHINIKLYNQS